jgi:hypothetical protein
VAVVKAVLAIDDLGLDRLTGEIPETTVETLLPMLDDIEAGLNALAPSCSMLHPHKTGPVTCGRDRYAPPNKRSHRSAASEFRLFRPVLPAAPGDADVSHANSGGNE